MSSRRCHRLVLLGAVGVGLVACKEPGVTWFTIEVIPTQLAYSTESPSPPVDQTVQVTNTGRGTLDIASVKLAKADSLSILDNELFTTDCTGLPRTASNLGQLAQGECAQFVVRFTPTVPESITNTVEIASNVPDQPTATVTVTAVNTWPPPICPTPPVAQIQASTVAGPLAPSGSATPGIVSFSGAGSIAIGAATIAAESWTLVSAPATSLASLAPASMSASLNAQVGGQYEVSLTVIDSNGCTSQPVTMPFTITIPPCWNVTPPTASITGTVGNVPLTSTGVLQDTPVSLDGTLSTGGTRMISRYEWSLASAPLSNTSQVVPNGPLASIDCTSGGTYVVQLVVVDTGGCASPPAKLDINVTAEPLTCGPSTEFIYAIDESGALYQFAPNTLTFNLLGPIQCPSPAGSTTVETMAVDRQGVAWVEYTDGTLYKVDTSTLACWPSGFVYNTNQIASTEWGSCFALDAPGSAQDTYFIQFNAALASINTTTLGVTQIGQIAGLGTSSFEAELTSTTNAELYGFFPPGNEGNDPWELVQLDPTNAQVLSVTPLPIIGQTVPGAGGWAFGAWNLDFYFFVNDGFQTTYVFHYDAATATTTLATTLTARLDGAGVSPCVQME